MANRLYDVAKRLYSASTIIQHNDLYGEIVHPSLGLFRFVRLLKSAECRKGLLCISVDAKRFLNSFVKLACEKRPYRDTTTGFPLKRCRRKERRNSTDDVSLPRSGSASKWSCRVANLLQPIRSVSQIWEVVRHKYGISACEVVLQTSFGRETSNGVAKWLP